MLRFRRVRGIEEYRVDYFWYDLFIIWDYMRVLNLVFLSLGFRFVNTDGSWSINCVLGFGRW